MGVMAGGNEDGVDLLVFQNILFVSGAEFEAETVTHRPGTGAGRS
jgi:hypothetical protein